MNPTQVNCKEACKNGCILGDQCPNLEYKSQASQFIQETSLDDMLAIADAAIRRRMTQSPRWVFPEDGVQRPES